MMSRRNAGATLVSLLVVGVGAYVLATQNSGVNVTMIPIVRGTQSTVTERVNYLITSTEELKELWQMLDAKGAPPKIDFSRESVLAIFAGKQSVKGTKVAVKAVKDTEVRTVMVEIITPCVEHPASVTPYEIVVVPITERRLTHQDTIKSECRYLD